MTYRSRVPILVAEKSVAENGKRFSMGDIAEVAGVSRAAISKYWMCSDAEIQLLNMKVAERLANWLGVQWYEIVEAVPVGDREM